jgi:uncharacterized protein YhbP (UPF0306 family)
VTDRFDRAWIEQLLRRNRYLVLATTDGSRPWIAPLEYVIDADLNLYFFSPEGVLHARHLEKPREVAVAVFDREQPEYTRGISATLNGVQIEATASKLAESDYPDIVVSAIDALMPPMPPYSVFKIEPVRWYVPMIEKGVNVRVQVPISA